MRKDKKRTLGRVKQVVISCVVAFAVIGLLVSVTYGHDIPVLNPKGLIADQERDLILITFGLGLVVVIPVFIMLFTIAWKYRASNTKARYEPDFASHKGIEALWWGIPCAIILLLAVITGIATHALDPYKPIDSSVKPVNIEVVSLNWKWLFIYPGQNIATINYLNIPKNTPINLQITSDAPMNSFWVPSLAGQVYAMSGMTTQLHMMADTNGSYNGSSANISGEGFAGMHFKVNSMNPSDFTTWAKGQFNSNSIPLLTATAYDKLSQPSSNMPDTAYLLMDNNLYNEVIMKYMSPGFTSTASEPGAVQ
jgi:cytochrome o ubiquinol oxidase subunit 2